VGGLWLHALLRYVQDPYKNEPSRHPALLVRSSKPFNGETPPELLTAAVITPVDMFYVRHHLPVPEVPADTYNLKVSHHRSSP
jgi:sulfite oxidase